MRGVGDVIDRAKAATLPVTLSGGGTRRLHQVARFAKRKPLGFIGAVTLFIVLVLAIFAPLIARYDPVAIDTQARLQVPSATHWFGTDQFGRDTFTRIVYGSRVSLICGFGAVAITIAISLLLGVASGYYRGKVDILTQRFVDAFMAIPVMVILLTAVFLLGNGLLNVTLVLGVISGPAASRIIRASTLTVMTNQYIEAAKATGATNRRIIVYHILPNIAAPIMVIATIWVGSNILAEAALSFLGLGIPPPAATWGNMLSLQGLSALSQSPWLAFFPGVFITLTVFGLNMLGDAIRDELDPSRRGL